MRIGLSIGKRAFRFTVLRTEFSTTQAIGNIGSFPEPVHTSYEGTSLFCWMARTTAFSVIGDEANTIPLFPMHAVKARVQASSHACLDPNANTYLLYNSHSLLNTTCVTLFMHSQLARDTMSGMSLWTAGNTNGS